jgi:2,3-bisphosphoglycerate-independent phosphoglycerate mutase
MKAQRPIVLLILDGWGIGEDDAHNAIYLARTPNLDRLLRDYPNGPIGAAGEHVGLEAGHQGSTEMGHLIIGAGRDVLLPQMQMRRALDSGSILENAIYRDGMRRAKQTGSRLHLIGLLSDSGVHSYDETAHALLELAAREGLAADQVLVHIFSDGRDSPPESLPDYVKRLEAKITDTRVGRIASVMGRYFAMDRDHRWERVEAAYRLLVEGRGQRTAKSIYGAIELARRNQETDEFIQPTLIVPDGFFQDGDVVINFNYRVDREIEITKALIEPKFEAFERGVTREIHYIATLPYYDGIPAPYAFEREELKMKQILPEVLSDRGYSQYRLTETEKWVYLTKIFNAMREEPFAGEERHLIESDKVATYDERPAMKAVEIAEDCAAQLRAARYDTYFLNICNADILGHTGNQEATIKGCEAIDRAVGMLVAAVQEANGVLLITADHGDAEIMWDFSNDQPHTQHTDSFVPFILVDDARRTAAIRETGTLKDIAPTILDLLGEPVPAEMTGRSLIVPRAK